MWLVGTCMQWWRAELVQNGSILKLENQIVFKLRSIVTARKHFPILLNIFFLNESEYDANECVVLPFPHTLIQPCAEHAFRLRTKRTNTAEKYIKNKEGRKKWWRKIEITFVALKRVKSRKYYVIAASNVIWMYTKTRFTADVPQTPGVRARARLLDLRTR